MDATTAQRLALLMGLSPTVAAEFVRALSAATEATTDFSTPISISGSLPDQGRLYGACQGANDGAPAPPLSTENTSALLTLENRGSGSENGCALLIKNGVLQGNGQNRILKFAQVRTTTTVVDAKSSDLAAVPGMGANVTSTYYASDCVEILDAKGRASTAVAKSVRVFQMDPSLPEKNDIVAYVYDTAGLAWRFGDSCMRAGAGVSGVAQGVATSAWSWASAGKVGSVAIRRTAGILNTAATGAAITVYIPATAGQDPNVQQGDLVQFREQRSGTNVEFIAVGSLDDKVGTVKMWGGTTSNIPKGWVLHTSLAGRFPVGYASTGSAFRTDAATGGSWPIRSHVLSSTTTPLTITHTSQIAAHGTTTLNISGGSHGHGRASCEYDSTPHRHNVSQASASLAAGTDYPNVGITVQSSETGDNKTYHTHNVRINTSSVSSHSHQAVVPSMSHTITTTPYHVSGQLSHDAPPYRVTMFIRRVGPA